MFQMLPKLKFFEHNLRQLYENFDKLVFFSIMFPLKRLLSHCFVHMFSMLSLKNIQ